MFEPSNTSATAVVSLVRGHERKEVPAPGPTAVRLKDLATSFRAAIGSLLTNSIPRLNDRLVCN